MPDEITIFPDTNGLLHYPPMKEIHWQELAGAKTVRLVLCMQVIHELDEKKGDSRLGDRAERVIKEIKTILASEGFVREGVTLTVFNHELRSADFPDSLSPDSKDDRIVHLAKKYLEGKAEMAAVYTEDIGMGLRCKGNGLAVIEPVRGTRLENPQTDQEKKYRAAITELNQLKNRQPVIEVTLTSASPSSERNLTVALRRPQAEDLDDLVAKEHKLLDATHHAADAHGGYSDPLHYLGGPTKEDWEKYTVECQQYMNQFVTWLTASSAAEAAKCLQFEFSVEVENRGTTVGKDVDIYLDFPPILKFIEGDGNDMLGATEDVPPKPERPKKPEAQTS